MMKEKKLTVREIILEDNGHYWIKFKRGKIKEPMIGKYDKKTDSFNLIDYVASYKSKKFKIISDIHLRDSLFRDF